jgi:aspartyl-tRNA(Asn)/glutamyl-tRNA(Gln) amidotransferase subunit A
MTIEEAAASLRARKTSSVELVQESLRIIREEQPRVNAFITITEDLALQRARQADDELARGVDRGPLHGIPYGLKDVYAAQGIATTCGSKIFAQHVAAHDSTICEKLAEAGAVLMGKNGLHEWAYGVTSNNPHFGAIKNPRDITRIPGGSSGGSAAAVVSNQVFFSIGSDTGGSIRVPAAYCGCVGLKPTIGRVSRYGGLPLGASLDHAGPLTRSARDAALVLNAIAGYDRRDDSSSAQPLADYLPEAGTSLAGRRLGIAGNFFNEGLSPAVAAAFEAAQKFAEQQGARLVPVTVPPPSEINTLGRLLLLVEMSAALEPYLERRADFGADVLLLLDQGRLISGSDYVNAQRLRRLNQRRWATIWEHVDALLTPTIGFEAPLVGQTTIAGEDVRAATTKFVRPFNVLGWPAISIPLPASGLPIGLQVIGKPFAEREILAIADRLSQAGS